MKRRTFLGVSASGAVATGLTGCEQAKKSSVNSDTEKKLAEFTLEELHEQYRSDLFNEFLPFMDKYIIDHEYGGFMCNANRDGTLVNTNKSTSYMGRGLWVYSFLYNNLDHDSKHLEVANNAAKLLRDNAPSDDSLWHGNLAKDGTPLGGVSNSVLGDLHISAGFAEYAKASGDSSYLKIAKETLMKCLRVHDRPNYLDGIGRHYLGPDAPLTPGFREINHWGHFLWAATRLLGSQNDSELVAIIDRCIDAIMNGLYQPEFDLIVAVTNRDGEFPDNELGQIVDTATVIESIWLILYEAVKRKDKQLFNAVANQFKRHFEVSWDDVYGGVYRYARNVDKNDWDLNNKALWAQDEVLINALYIIEHTGEQWAKDIYAKTYTYVQDKFPLKQYGYSLWILYADRKLTFEPKYERIGNYHHPRQLMHNLLCLDRIMERGGKVSQVFA